MVCSSTCLVMSSSLCIVPWFLKSISAGACVAKTVCWVAVITAKQIFVKKYRTMIIIIRKKQVWIHFDKLCSFFLFTDVETQNIVMYWAISSTAVTWHRGGIKLKVSHTTHEFYVSARCTLQWSHWYFKYRPSNLSLQVWRCWLFQEQFPFRLELPDAWEITLNKITLPRTKLHKLIFFSRSYDTMQYIN